jgi:hypothetical protein
MALRPILDLDLLRTLVCIAEESSFTRAAQRVGRTQSEITLQVQQLEALVGQRLGVRWEGGPIDDATATPWSRPRYASLNDETFRSLASESRCIRVASAADSPSGVQIDRHSMRT